MPILPPSTPTIQSIGSDFTIGNCVNNLPFKFGNRQNFGLVIPGTTNFTNQNQADGSIAVTAVMEAIKELTETYEFEELKYQTPVPPAATLGMTAGNPIIPIGTLLGTIAGNTNYPQFQNQNFVDITDVYTFWMWLSASSNQAGRTLKYRRVTTIDNYSYGIASNTTGQLGTAPPAYYTRFGNILQVGPVPDKGYAFFVRVKLRHPFPVGGTTTFTPATLTATLSGGAVNGFTVVNGGNGYIPSLGNIPVICGVSPNGTQATGTATSNSSGVITSVAVGTAGSGYTVAPTANTSAISAQQVFMPDSWQEIVEICACRRLALWEGAADFVEMFDKELSRKGIDIPAAQARKKQMERDELHNERQLSVRVASYTHA